MAVILAYSMLQSRRQPQIAPDGYPQPSASEASDTQPAPEAEIASRALASAQSAKRAQELAAAKAAMLEAVGDTVPETERTFSGGEDSYEARLSNRGAALTAWTLQGFTGMTPESSRPAKIELVTPGVAGRAPRTAFLELGLGDLSEAVYEIESETPERIVFALERGGITIRKLYEFDFERYSFDLSIEIHNGSERTIAPEFAFEWPVENMQGNDYSEQSMLALHADEVERELLPSVGVPGFFSRIFGGDEGEQPVWSTVRWAGADLKFFVSLLIPENSEGSEVRFEALEPGVRAATVLQFRPQQLAPGETQTKKLTGFLGPKKPELLEAVGRDVSRSVDLGYSWIQPLTLFFHWLLATCYRVIPNYGWSIVLITIMVRVATLPIMNKQMRSMEKMRALQPQLKELQAEHSDDRQKQSEATMALYKEMGVNPLGGCLPMLLQFPVFVGLFFALRSSFELRQAPFIWWITDLSAPEALFVIPGIELPFRLLPVIMGASMILQQRLTPTTVDPSQQAMMMFMMPIMMTVLFYQFPSGLVLYWMISNFLGIAQQLLVGRRMRAAEA